MRKKILKDIFPLKNIRHPYQSLWLDKQMVPFFQSNLSIQTIPFPVCNVVSLMLSVSDLCYGEEGTMLLRLTFSLRWRCGYTTTFLPWLDVLDAKARVSSDVSRNLSLGLACEWRNIGYTFYSQLTIRPVDLASKHHNHAEEIISQRIHLKIGGRYFWMLCGPFVAKSSIGIWNKNRSEKEIVWEKQWSEYPAELRHVNQKVLPNFGQIWNDAYLNSFEDPIKLRRGKTLQLWLRYLSVVLYLNVHQHLKDYFVFCFALVPLKSAERNW